MTSYEICSQRPSLSTCRWQFLGHTLCQTDMELFMDRPYPHAMSRRGWWGCTRLALLFLLLQPSHHTLHRMYPL